MNRDADIAHIAIGFTVLQLMDEAPARTSSRCDLGWPILVYAVVLLPFCAHLLLFYPDERFYLDASLAMYRTGDALVPRLDDGTPRLNKPLLTYWLMLASFHVFGPHLLAARLPFFLAGVGVLGFTYHLAWHVTGRRQIAQLAAWILLANPLFWLSCARCLPDVLLALFALMAVFGYFALRATQWDDRRAAWLLCGGLGLAFGVKGLPALLLLGCIGMHAILWRRELPPAFSRSMMLPAFVSAIIGVASFAPIFWHDAPGTAVEIWRDQFSSRLVGRTWGVVYRLPLLVVILAALHLPWLLACVMPMDSAQNPRRRRTAWAGFLTLTGSLWFGATAATENCSVRYLLPLFPWWAVALADWVSRCDAQALRRFSRRFVVALALLVVTVAGLGLAMASQLSGERWAVPALMALIIIAFGLLFWCRAADAWRRLQAGCALGPMVLLAGFCAAAPALLPELGTQASSSLDALDGDVDAIAVLGSPCQASRVRLALAGEQTVVRRLERDANEEPVLLVAQSQGTRLHEQGYELVPAARSLERVPLAACLAAATRGELESFLHAQTTVYCWAVRRQ